MHLSERLHEGYTQLLLRQPWHWTGTFTFAPKAEGRAAGVHPERADKAFRFFVSSLNGSLFGTNWNRKTHGGIVWARGEEFHKSGRIHFHSLFAAPHDDLNNLAHRLTWMDFWYQHFGIARIEQPVSQNDVAGYVSKYVTKGGQVDLSQNFGRYIPPELDLQGTSRAWTKEQKPTAGAEPKFSPSASQKAVTECRRAHLLPLLDGIGAPKFQPKGGHQNGSDH